MSAAARALFSSGRPAAAWRLLLHAAARTAPDDGYAFYMNDQNEIVETSRDDPCAVVVCQAAAGGTRWRPGSGPLRAQARALLDLYLPALAMPERGIAVVAHLGQSLDGFVATASGASHYVTGEQNLVHLHRMRALFDAVLVGAETVRADNPRLTVRRVDGPNPLRVVVDPRASLDGAAHIMDGGHTLLVHAGPEPGGGYAKREGLSRAWLNAPGGRLEPARVLDELASHGVRRVFVEGGGRTVSVFLEAGALQRLQITVAPVLIGSGRPGVRVPPAGHMDDAFRPACRRFDMGDDALFDFSLQS